MRSNFGSKNKKNDGSNWSDDYGFSEHADSPDQLAIVDGSEDEVVSAIPVPGAVAGSYDLDVARLPLGFDLGQALKLRRENHFDQSAVSDQTNFLTVVSDYSERTRILALNGEVLALNDFELSEWLVNAERQMLLGTDSHPIFETALDDTACSVRRLPNGLVAMTEVPRQHIEAARGNMRSIFGEQIITPTNLTVETPLRSAARYFLTAMPEGGAVLGTGRETEVTAFLMISRSGFSYGLWSPSAGLFSEYAFLAPRDLSGGQKNRLAKNSVPAYESYKSVRNAGDAEKDKVSASDSKSSTDESRLQSYVKNAFDQLFLQLSPEKLEQLQLTNYSQVVWATEPELVGTVAPIADRYSKESGLNFFQINVPLDEAAAGGLLFGSFTFGDETVAGAQILPPVNLARDLLILADKEEIARRLQGEVGALKMRSRAVFALWAAPVLVLACLLALTADIVRQKIMLAVRDTRAEMQTAELKPALERRKSYEENLKWYQEFIKEVSALRRQQPVGIGMLYELDRNYPLTVDPSFFVSDLKLLPNGGVELKGLARNKDAVTSFLRSLEFAGGPESGSRMFSNLTYEVQEGVAAAVVPV
ncbi:MAG: hypothetical protein ABIP06_11630, partial [Pyrinomonadaceae bacterium]